MRDKVGRKIGRSVIMRETNPLYGISAAIMRGILKLGVNFGYRPKIVYENKAVKKYIKKHPVIFTPNHGNYKDGPVIYFKFPRCALMIAKDWYEHKGIRWVTYSKDAIPLDRTGLDTGWLRSAVSMIKDGKNVLIFPEGHTTDDGEIDKFKAGFIMLSVMTGAPVVPMYIDGEFHPFLGKRLKIYVGDLENLTEEGKSLNSDYMEKECNRFRNILIEMKENYSTK